MKQKNKYESRHLEKCLSPFISLRSHISPFRYQPSRSFTFLSHIFVIPGERNFQLIFRRLFLPLSWANRTNVFPTALFSFYLFAVYVLNYFSLHFSLFKSFYETEKACRVALLSFRAKTIKLNITTIHHTLEILHWIKWSRFATFSLNSDIKKHLFRIKIDLLFAVFIFLLQKIHDDVAVSRRNVYDSGDMFQRMCWIHVGKKVSKLQEKHEALWKKNTKISFFCFDKIWNKLLIWNIEILWKY